MYDESIEVCDDDEEEEYELLESRRRPGVSPVRRGPFQFQQQQQRPSRSFVRDRHSFQREDSVGMSDEGSPAPPPAGPPPPLQQLHHDDHKKSMSSKDFVGKSLSPQQSQDGGGGKQHENLMSLASNFAKKMMSGSDKKEKPPSDVVEAVKRERDGKGSGHGPKKQSLQHQTSSTSSTMSPAHGKHQSQPVLPPTQQQQQRPPPQSKSQSVEDEEDDEDEEDEYDDVNMAQIEGLLNQVQKPSDPHYSNRKYFEPRAPPGNPRLQRSPALSFVGQNNPSGQRRDSIDRGAAGEPYSVRTAAPGTIGQFYPGFGPATSNLMNFSGSVSISDSDPEVSISEGDMDLTQIDELMDIYSNSDGMQSDPATSMIMPLPTAQLNSMAMVDDEIFENMLAHRKMWEYQLDLKRESLRRRTLVMSDNPGVHAPGNPVYNPQDYEQLNVSPEVKELFHYITRYEPPVVGTQMDVKLKAFIPEYYPSVGDIDAFIKVVHPEIPDDNLGIKHLDEPSPFQSDPSVLDLRLRALAKQSSSKSVVVKKIDNVGKNTKIIENWIKDISDLHRSKPSPSVHYSKPMPDIDALIQEWPPQLEELLKNISLPSADLDCDLQTYVDIVCSLLDIPVYKSRIQSLHVLCTLYATYKHFNHYAPLGMSAGGGGTDLEILPSSTSGRMDNSEIDRLQIN